MNLKKIPNSWYFLLSVILVYLSFLILKKEIFLESLGFFVNIFLRLIPLFIIIFLLMGLTNYFITPKFILKHLREKGLKKWFFVIFGGILSSGPIYMWYPLLADLKKRGLSYGLIACFLYNRAIKIPLIPLAVVYFGWTYVLLLSLVMIVASVVQGIFLNKLMEVKNENSSSF